MKKLLIATMIGGASLGGLAAAHALQSTEHGPAVVSAEATETIAQFSVENMTCATCPISVRSAMRRVDGVISVEIDTETNIATVAYDPALTTTAEIAAASTNVGYPANEIDE